MKSKDKSSKQSFGHVNTKNRWISFLLNYLHNEWNTKSLKFRLLRFFLFFFTTKDLVYLIPISTALIAQWIVCFDNEWAEHHVLCCRVSVFHRRSWGVGCSACFRSSCAQKGDSYGTSDRHEPHDRPTSLPWYDKSCHRGITICAAPTCRFLRDWDAGWWTSCCYHVVKCMAALPVVLLLLVLLLLLLLF